MRDLLATLLDRDLGDLRAIAERWGIELPAQDPPSLAAQLARTLTDPAELADFVAGLPDLQRQALQAVQARQGRLPLSEAEQRFGEWRRMGSARRDRLQPHRQPLGALEGLAYTGLIGRAFAEGPGGSQEFVFIPLDLRPLLPAPPAPSPFGLPASEPAHQQPAARSAGEDATTLLAAIRRNPVRPGPAFLSHWTAPIRPFLFQPQAAELLVTLLQDLGLAAGDPLSLDPEAIRRFLEADDAVRPSLLEAWRTSARWNDLGAVASLSTDGRPWPNDPLATREAVVECLASVPAGSWWDLESWIDAIQRDHPGFLRRAGDFDAWYLRDPESGDFLRGYENWHRVEGALLRQVIAGPLHWLGIADLGAPASGSPPSAFRLAPFPDWDAGRMTQPSASPAKARLQPDGTLVAPLGMPLSLRYQLARWLTWESRGADAFIFRLTAAGLRLAGEQGLRPGQIVTLLEAGAAGEVPAVLRRALERFTDKSEWAEGERPLIVRTSTPGLLDELRNNRTTGRYLGQRMGEDAAVVAAADWSRLKAAALRLGILIDDPELP